MTREGLKESFCADGLILDLTGVGYLNVCIFQDLLQVDYAQLQNENLCANTLLGSAVPGTRSEGKRCKAGKDKANTGSVPYTRNLPSSSVAL